ncbi:hypothetical protein AURANDRAFT_19641 [Aureococcus anophagefferens]|uniref:Helicase C-terminal domain-containing protein n=1 Tax=Aureococcus anophagefferens TaxID=44056 RepID=F0XZB3_AURAN|nr:hypothetical protein AURANDRAFT_19641 [Aureococcus anophagefferens]EGB12379.1 hypothetical protein AURANDRAFT_19641 [Aureococcus anophagefferens]|eukprot:XP_009033415.1 hypothetical protein AURANDRAFT_19641 [Aureococcus anophagefferens]
MTLAKSRHACQRSKAKRAALLADLEARRGRARGCRAVIFTEYKDVHAELVRDLRQTFPSFRVFEFSGGTDANVRHRSIREFQADEGPPDRIFVITMRAGSVGITLTAADVVYLLGPCVDPADEVQAAGRIHRLGQSSDVLIKKFVVNGTVEASICELHDKIKAGALALDSANVSRAAATLLCRQVRSFVRAKGVLKERASLLVVGVLVEALLELVEARLADAAAGPGLLEERAERGLAARRCAGVAKSGSELSELALAGLLVAAVADEIRTPDAAAAARHGQIRHGVDVVAALAAARRRRGRRHGERRSRYGLVVVEA